MEKPTDTGIIGTPIEGLLLEKVKADARSLPENRISHDSSQDSIRLNGSIETKFGVCCFYCHDYYFESILGRKNHMAHAINQGVTKHGLCEFCTGFENKEEFGLHLMTKHPLMYFRCFWCEKYYRTQRQLEEHVRSHTDTHQNHSIHLTPMENSLRFMRNNVEEEDKQDSLKLGEKNSARCYGCTECHRKFKSYENMCRHRRLQHNSYAGKKTKRSILAKKTKEQEEMDFYANIKSNVAGNLEHHLDGKDIPFFDMKSPKQDTHPNYSDDKENQNCRFTFSV